MTYALFFGGGKDRGGFYVYAVFPGELQDGAGQLRLKFLGTIAEICLGGTHVRCIRHRVFAALRESIDAVGQFASFFGIQSVIHNCLSLGFFFKNK